VLVFDKDRCILIEGDHQGREQRIKEIKDDYVARTNHGIMLPKAGYQPHSRNKILELRRLSSESRLYIANHVVEAASTPNELMVLLAHKWIDNPQLNNLRTATAEISTRTTEQLMLEPAKLLMIVRNVDGTLDFKQSTANPAGSQIEVGIV
jgi:hypothetical protein